MCQAALFAWDPFCPLQVVPVIKQFHKVVLCGFAVWNALSPAYLIVRGVAENSSNQQARFYAREGLMPIFEAIKQCAANYKQNGGMCYRAIQAARR